MAGYKVRISDGSEIGPMDMAALKTWYSQGLIDGDSPVMRTGTRKWVTLGTLPEFHGASGRRSAARRERRRAAEADEPDEDLGVTSPPALDGLRVRATGVLLLAAAAGLGLLSWRPDVVLPAFDGVPWLRLALGALALALALLPGWSLTRRLVRVVVILAAFALFPLAGILIAQGERGAAVLALASAWLFLSGLVALLAPELGVVGLALSLLVVAAGAAGAVRFGHAPDNEAVQEAREWASPENAFRDDTVGITLDPPAGWVVLKPGNPLLAAPDDSRVTLAHPRLGGFGYLVAAPAPRGVATADQYLSYLLARRRQKLPTIQEKGRANAIVGSLTARRLDATWSNGDVVERDVTVAALDGWMSFALVAWMPETNASRPRALDALVEGLGARGLLASRLRDAVETVAKEVPHLSPPVAELLMSKTEARVLEPDQAFRRSVAALAHVLPSLSAAETRELSTLSTATYAGLPWAQRSQLAGYIERVRRGDTTDPAEDKAMARLMKSAEMRLTGDQRLRLQTYYERAVQAAP